MDFCEKIYNIQRKVGRYFVHEHPKSTCSRKESSINDIAEDEEIFKADSCMCRFGIKSEDATGVAPVRKPTTSMTNSIDMKKLLERPCPGCPRHVQFLWGRAAAAAAAAQVYPKGLCRALSQGISKQARADAQSLMSLECGEVAMDVDIDNIEHEAEDWRSYWDDTSGEPLDTGLAKEAREEDIREVHRMGVYIKASLEECARETGKATVGTRWVGVNKGDAKNPKVRSRLVAQEVAVTKQRELFAATPPIEYIRYLPSCVASWRTLRSWTSLVSRRERSPYVRFCTEPRGLRWQCTAKTLSRRKPKRT